MKRALLLAAGAAALLRAQPAKEYDFHLDNGAEVLYQTFTQADAKNPVPDLGTARAFGNVIERSVMDSGNARRLGFDLHIDKLPGDPVRFRVSMGPLEKWGYFGWSAAPREIQNGDRVLMDVLEEPVSGNKIYDTFQVGIGVGMHFMPMAKTIPRIPGTGMAIHLQSPCSLAGAASVKSAGNVAGEAVGVSIPERGVFALSTSHGLGYRMEGIAEGNVLTFVSGSERYDIQCAAPVVDGAGAWYLWVRPEPAGMLKNPLEFTPR